MTKFNQKKISIEHIEPLCKILGVNLEALQELNYDNIQAFNECIPNK